MHLGKSLFLQRQLLAHFLVLFVELVEFAVTVIMLGLPRLHLTVQVVELFFLQLLLRLIFLAAHFNQLKYL